MNIKKSDVEEIRVAITEFRNKEYLDIRNYVKAKGGTEFIPTPKGISIPMELAQDVLEAMTAVLPSKTIEASTKYVISNSSGTRFYRSGDVYPDIVFTKNMDKAQTFLDEKSAKKMIRKFEGKVNGTWSVVDRESLE